MNCFGSTHPITSYVKVNMSEEEISMKRIVNSRILLVGIFAFAGLPNLHAQRGCSTATLNGAYGFYSSGIILPARTPRITVGREVYDGNGHFANTFTVNDNGAVSHNASSGTYNVNPDCTGPSLRPWGCCSCVWTSL